MRTTALISVLLLLLGNGLSGQRQYAGSSVLANGRWYKIGITKTGVYKIDVSFLAKLGINTNHLASSSIRVFGNGGAMLPEACNGKRVDDLIENAVDVEDGGDGLFNNNDYLLFFGAGTAGWTKDSLNHRFHHQQNLYSDTAFYYITIGGAGKRIAQQNPSPPANVTVSGFSERYCHELDSVNLLNSGKDWYGEAFSAQPGHHLSQTFTLPVTHIITGEPATLVSNCVARSIGTSSQFDLRINGLSVLQQTIDATGSSNLDLFAKASEVSATVSTVDNPILTYTFNPGSSDAEGWLDWFEFFCRKTLVINGKEQLLFRDWNSVGAGNIASFSIQNGATVKAWDITDIFSPVAMSVMAAQASGVFVNDASSLHEYIAFSTSFFSPAAIGAIANQDLHRASQTDMLIVSYPPLLPAAASIAAYHQQRDKINTMVVSTDQVYNEFSSGIPDPVAIRDFVKMYYDRAAGDSTKRPRYLLLLGDASYDYKHRVKNNTNFLPAYENNFSLDPLSSYTSDDFFGFLDDNDDVNSGTSNQIDIGIGRIPAQTLAQANAHVEKLVNYADTSSLGAWRNQLSFIADDQDYNLHLNDAEAITTAAAATNPLFLQDKLYLDAFPQVSTPAGSRYPAANAAINEDIGNGTLILNYNGHGSATRLAEEVVLEKDIVDTWNNAYRLPLFITATCDFAPFDNPAVNSLGENILLREKTGAIALMTTTRLVFAYSNRIMNRNYLQTALQPRPDGSYLSLGDAVRIAKNYTYQTQADITNNRKFTLLGDPALTLAFPALRVQTDSIDGKAVSASPDTLRALGNYHFQGSIRNAAGVLQTGFNGVVDAIVFDKPQTLTTRANDPDSYQQNFQVQTSRIFHGTASVSGGRFSISFTVPKDINYQPGAGRISYYASNGVTDANGNFSAFQVASSLPPNNDTAGPLLKGWLNTEQFIDGSMVNPAPLLLLQLRDGSGLNIMGTGIGHDLVASVDGDPSQSFVLNDYFIADKDQFASGTVRFQLPAMEEGEHSIEVKAWDGANNSSTIIIHFRVAKQGISIVSLMNFPNPVQSHTVFRFTHNRPNTNLDATIHIYTAFGKLVKTIATTINTSENRSSDIEWNGAGNNNERLAPGIYIYRLQLRSSTEGIAVKSGKLVVP